MNNSLMSLTAVSDLVTVLKSKNLKDSEIAKIVLQIVTEVEIETIEELSKRLTEDKKRILNQLIEQGVGDTQIFSRLGINEKDVQEVELKKFSEIVQRLSPFLNFE